MHTRRSSLLVVCIALVLLHGCRTLNNSLAGVDVTLQIPPQPHVGPTTLNLTIKRSAQPVTGARVRLEANMSHAGMAPVFGDAIEIEPGRYRSTIDLPMAGDWYVLVHLTLQDGSKDDYKFDLDRIVREVSYRSVPARVNNKQTAGFF